MQIQRRLRPAASGPMWANRAKRTQFPGSRGLGTPDCAKRTQFRGAKCAQRSQFGWSAGAQRGKCAKRTQSGPAWARHRQAKDAKRTQFAGSAWARRQKCAKRTQFRLRRVARASCPWFRIMGKMPMPRDAVATSLSETWGKCAKRTQFARRSQVGQGLRDKPRRVVQTNPISARQNTHHSTILLFQHSYPMPMVRNKAIVVRQSSPSSCYIGVRRSLVRKGPFRCRWKIDSWSGG